MSFMFLQLDKYLGAVRIFSLHNVLIKQHEKTQEHKQLSTKVVPLIRN